MIRYALPLLALGLATTARAETAEAQAAFRDRLPSEEIVYFVLPDRFENGDRTNDRAASRAIAWRTASTLRTRVSSMAATSRG